MLEESKIQLTSITNLVENNKEKKKINIHKILPKENNKNIKKKNLKLLNFIFIYSSLFPNNKIFLLNKYM